MSKLTKLERLAKLAERGYGIESKDVKYLINVQKRTEKMLMLKTTALGMIHDDPLKTLAELGWVRKLKIGRLAVVWMTKEDE